MSCSAAAKRPWRCWPLSADPCPLRQSGPVAPTIVKEISLVEVLLRGLARFAAVSGVIAFLVWITWVMLDVKNMQSGFTLP